MRRRFFSTHASSDLMPSEMIRRAMITICYMPRAVTIEGFTWRADAGAPRLTG